MTTILGLPREIVLKIFQDTNYSTKENISLVSKRFHSIVSEFTKSIVFPHSIADSQLASFLDHFPKKLKKICFVNWRVRQIIQFLEKADLKVETLSFRYILALTDEEECLLGEALKKIKSLKTLEIVESSIKTIDSSIKGTCVIGLSINTCILVGCREIEHLILPPTVNHLDVSYSANLKKIISLNQIKLLRAKEVGVSRKGFQGIEYLPKDFLNDSDLKKNFEEGANPNFLEVDDATLLHWAARYPEKKEIAALLLEKGGSPNAATETGTTPLHIAVELRNEDGVALLLEHGANPNAKNCDGRTPLHGAVAGGFLGCVSLLLKSGANPNLTEKDGNTPLHLSTLTGKISIVSSLISKVTNVNISNRLGLTPLHLAVKDSHNEIATLLLEKGADPNAEDLDKMTPLDWAEKRNDKQMCSLLLEKGAIPRNRTWGSCVCM